MLRPFPLPAARPHHPPAPRAPCCHSFVTRHPEALTSIMTLSAAATVGQLFIRWGNQQMCAQPCAASARPHGSLALPCLLPPPLPLFFTSPNPPTPNPTPTPPPSPNPNPIPIPYPPPPFCSHTIKTFGALLFATVMTTRQFISILLSCILFAHPLSGGQWVGTVMVFGALYYKSLSKGGGHKGGSKDAAPAGAAAEAEKLPLVHADAVGAEGAGVAAEPLK